LFEYAFEELNLFQAKLSDSFGAFIPNPALLEMTTGMFLARRVTSVSIVAAGQLELYPAATLFATPVPPMVGAFAHRVEGVAGEMA
jgi:hypothetical protein